MGANTCIHTNGAAAAAAAEYTQYTFNNENNNHLFFVYAPNMHD